MAHKRHSFAEHVARIRCDKEWIDASVVHALGCVFSLDVFVWQLGMDPAVVGISAMVGSHQRSLGSISVAMVNDLHFWGVVAQDAAPLHAAVAPPEDFDNGDFIGQPCQAEGLRHKSAHDEDGALVRAHACWGNRSNEMSTQEIDKELALCSALTQWNPWALPSAAMLSAMQLAGGSTSSERCILRSQVVEQIAYETIAADALPDMLKYHAGARYRLRMNRPLVPTGCTKQRVLQVAEHLETHSLLTTPQLEKKLSQSCVRSGADHQCLLPFRANPAIVYNWRLLWRSLPATMRREALLHMAVDSLRRHNEANMPGAWVIKYKVLGQDVCRTAFEFITGIGGPS